MNRRQVLAGAGVVFLPSGSGCLGAVLDSDSDESEPTPEPQDHPGFPSSVTPETAVEFVEAYEEVEYDNRLLESGDRRPDSVSVGCNALLDRSVADDLYVVSVCYGSSRTEDSVSDFASAPYTHRVSEHGFQRIPTERIERLDRTGDYPLYAQNFDDSAHELRLTIRPVAASDDDDQDGDDDRDRDEETGAILEETRTLDSETGLEVPFGSEVDSGAYELAASRHDGDAETVRWEIDREFAGITVYVTPEGAIDAGVLPDRSQW